MSGARRFPKADPEAAHEFYELGRAKLTRLSFLTASELRQSIGLALEAHQTGRTIQTLRSHTHLCGPRRRKK